ncbi:threonine-phosphate decarboxylase CobD [Microvirga lotononidis]|uniref:8-amino-7-oxononanoate synthase n=1 Tax=Microvirga lotononidis TaxID=864069 RepID=I4YWU8_9HYPH|nr:threonine-phosphate decarboxylase CobD [Microvirga lotononidis]EIM28440.1 L-threonine-O-3-phosphate decarboxylase [Microvirga lotononidis]WQO27481.1 threonine-phosphate decarboxylase CobD [Microvirga lotononidis]
MSEARIWHGGDLDEARRLFPDAPEPWIDLSTGINPIAYPMPPLPARLFERLPSPADHRDLEAAAAEAYGAADPAMVVGAPGTQVLISLLPILWPRSRVTILGPTYAEHAHAWRGAGHAVAEIGSLDEAGEADILVVVNPNNPDGRLLRREVLLEQAVRFGRRGGRLLVDEAFADFDGNETLVSVLPENTVVLRSFGKTYGLAGVRLGFAVAATTFAETLRKALGPWSVSGPAMEVGRRALRDRSWREAAQAARAEDARRLDALLEPLSSRAPGGTILYRLMDSSRASDVFSHLGHHGIWVRRFQHDPRLLRFGLPGSAEAWRRLETVLADLHKG